MGSVINYLKPKATDFTPAEVAHITGIFFYL